MTHQLDQRETRLLHGIALNERVVARYSPQDWWETLEHDQWATDVEHGPLWSATRWFSAATNAEVMRWTRALRRLEKLGLVEVYRLPRRRETHVKITTAGRKLLRQLTAEQNGNPVTQEESIR